jgi:predicted RNA binding protein YcfA (HicA-like mRNA interferase family)
MSKDLKLCSGAEAVRKLQRAGWSVARQRGSHVLLTKAGYAWTLSVPQHKDKELGPGLLRKLLRQANLTVEEFNKL